jgi:anoctamin-10
MTWLAAFVNSSLIYMFKPRAVSQRSLLVDKFAHVVNNTLPINVISNNTFHSTPIYQAAAVSTDTFASIRATMFTALLVGLASEHAYLLARWATRHVLREVLWRHSAEEVELRNANFVMKRQYLDAMRLEVPQVDTNSLAQEDSDEAFYGGGDQGLAEIQRLYKAQ